MSYDYLDRDEPTKFSQDLKLKLMFDNPRIGKNRIKKKPRPEYVYVEKGRFRKS